MLVTPGTVKSHAGSSLQNGSTQPPMHASTCSAMPCSAAAAATSATGSRAACG